MDSGGDMRGNGGGITYALFIAELHPQLLEVVSVYFMEYETYSSWINENM